MTRDELIKLAVECHWRRGTLDNLERGLWSISPGDPESSDPTVHLWDMGTGFSKHVGYCPLSKLRFRRHSWIVGPFSGKYFSLKTQKLF